MVCAGQRSGCKGREHKLSQHPIMAPQFFTSFLARAHTHARTRAHTHTRSGPIF